MKINELSEPHRRLINQIIQALPNDLVRIWYPNEIPETFLRMFPENEREKINIVYWIPVARQYDEKIIKIGNENQFEYCLPELGCLIFMVQQKIIK